ncbi:MAG: glycosyltransferase family 2 protein [Candidatus Nanopelagicales bacterium]
MPTTPAPESGPGRARTGLAGDAALLDEVMPAGVEPVALAGEHRVTALVIARNGARWLPRTLQSLARQHRPPDETWAVDAESTDGSGELLTAAAGVSVRVPSSGWASSANAALSERLDRTGAVGAEQPTSWIWLIHDDSAPAPSALASLLDHADRHPEGAVIGPKVVGWADPIRLVDAGRLWAPGAPQVARVEREEHDQGQHDQPTRVYALGSPGLLIRAELLSELGGFDALAPGDTAAADVCRRAIALGYEVWMAPSAVVAHRRAGEMGVRDGTSLRGYRQALRAGQLRLELTQAPWWALPWRGARAVVSTVVRCLSLLITRDPAEAIGEFVGAARVLSRPGELLAARRAARAAGGNLHRPAELRAPRWAVTRHAIDSWTSAGHPDLKPGGGASGEWGRQPRLPAWLMPAVMVALIVGALIVNSALLLGPGLVQGGGLLPSAGASDLLGQYLRGWHEVGFGSARPAPAYLPLLGLLAAPLLGSPDLLLRLLIGGYVPLAFLTAYLCLGRRWPGGWRLALALGYALLPAGLAASEAGRLSTLALGLLGPPTVRLVAGALVRPRSRRWAVWAGLLAGVTTSFAPMAWLMLLGWALSSLLQASVSDQGDPSAPGRQRRDLLQRWILLAVAAAGVNLLWLPQVGRWPGLLLLEAGVNSAGLRGSVPSWFGLGLSPGGPGAPAFWVGIPVLLLAFGSALHSRGDQRIFRLAALSCAVAASSLLVATLCVRLRLSTPLGGARVAAWPGAWLLLAGAAALMAIGFAARPVYVGWQPPAARRGLVPAAALAVGVLLWSWFASPPGPTGTSPEAVLPAVAAADAVSPQAPRVLVLRRDSGTATVSYYLSSGSGSRLGDADVALAGPAQEGLDHTVAGMVSAAGVAAGRELGPRGIGYVVFTGASDDPAISAIDSAGGLRRLSSGSDQALWLVVGHVDRAQVAGPDGAEPAMVPVELEPVRVGAVLHPDLGAPMQFSLAERADLGWQVTLDEARIAAGADPDTGLVSAQLPTAGVLRVWHRDRRGALVSAQLALLSALFVLGLPKRRRVDPDSVPDGGAPSLRLRTVEGGENR